MNLEIEKFLENQTEMLGNLTITDSIDVETLTDICEEYHKRKLKLLGISDVSERFSSEGEILQWLYLNTPFAIKPKSKHAKTLLVSPFTSNHAFEEVCKNLANKLYNAR